MSPIIHKGLCLSSTPCRACISPFSFPALISGENRFAPVHANSVYRFVLPCVSRHSEGCEPLTPFVFVDVCPVARPHCVPNCSPATPALFLLFPPADMPLLSRQSKRRVLILLMPSLPFFLASAAIPSRSVSYAVSSRKRPRPAKTGKITFPIVSPNLESNLLGKARLRRRVSPRRVPHQQEWERNRKMWLCSRQPLPAAPVAVW